MYYQVKLGIMGSKVHVVHVSWFACWQLYCGVLRHIRFGWRGSSGVACPACSAPSLHIRTADQQPQPGRIAQDRHQPCWHPVVGRPSWFPLQTCMFVFFGNRKILIEFSHSNKPGKTTRERVLRFPAAVSAVIAILDLLTTDNWSVFTPLLSLFTSSSIESN